MDEEIEKCYEDLERRNMMNEEIEKCYEDLEYQRLEELLDLKLALGEDFQTPIAQLVRATDFNITMERRRRNTPDDRRYMLGRPESPRYSSRPHRLWQ